MLYVITKEIENAGDRYTGYVYWTPMADAALAAPIVSIRKVQVVLYNQCPNYHVGDNGHLLCYLPVVVMSGRKDQIYDDGATDKTNDLGVRLLATKMGKRILDAICNHCRAEEAGAPTEYPAINPEWELVVDGDNDGGIDLKTIR